MCMGPESFIAFLQMIPPEHIELLADGFITVGERNTLWVWLAEHGVWCIQGVFG